MYQDHCQSWYVWSGSTVSQVWWEFCVDIDHHELFKSDIIFFYSHLAMTTSKWDLLEQEEEKAPPEDLDGQ